MSDTEVKIADEKDLEVWDKIVDSSEMGTIFHKLDWLRAAEKHTKTKLYPLIGYEGREVVSLFPVFYKKKAFIKMSFSPPPKCAIPFMGPVFKYLSGRQTSIEKLHNSIINKAMCFLNNDLCSENSKKSVGYQAFYLGSPRSLSQLYVYGPDRNKFRVFARRLE
jgi:hypothetical protein